MLCYRGNPYCGGQGVYLYNLTREMASLGHEVTLAVGPPYPEPMPWARVIRLPNHQFWGKRRDFLPRENPISIFSPLNFFEFATSRLGYFPEILAFSLRAYKTFRALNEENPFYIIHDVETLGYGTWLARKNGVPAVSTVHHPLWRDMASHLMQSGGWLERYYNVVFFPLIMQGFVARRLDGIITSSLQGVREIRKAFGVHRDKIHLVYSGVDLKTFSPDPRVRRDPLEILFVGNAQDPRKGIKTLLEALTLLPEKLRLTIVDQDEPQKSYAPSLVKTMGLSERVRFTGKIPMEALLDAYRRARVLVMPSFFEGFGLPVAEAMACATPVIVSSAGSLPEVAGEGGLVVEPGDPRALAHAIERIALDDQLASELGQNGLQRIRERFSWETTARETLAVYMEIIDSAGSFRRAL